jgi:apolipoprotein N-acyltransferase
MNDQPESPSNSVVVKRLLDRVPASVQALVGGILTTLTVPPFSWWPLALPGIGLLLLALLNAGRRRGCFGLSMLWAAALYVPSFWWMTAFSLPGGVIAPVIQALFTALCCLVLVPSASRVSQVRVAAGLVSALVTVDALRSLWPFGGVPLAGIDLGQANGPFAPIARWLGRLGVIGFVALVACALTMFLTAETRRVRLASLGVGMATFMVASAPLVLLRWSHDVQSEADIATHTIRVIQGGGPRGLRASIENAGNTFAAHLAATTANQRKKMDFVELYLWPENTVDATNFATSKELEELRKLNVGYMSVGVVEDGGPKEFLNAQVMINPAGELVDRYDKVRRVPFGEFFPFRKQIEGWGLADLPNRDARPGNSPGILRAGDTTYGVLISYEGFFDDRGRNAVRAGGQVLLIPTNASSFKTDQLPSQQIAAAQLRAWETNRDVVQAGPTGYSAHITVDGNVRYRTELGTREVFDAQVTLRTGQTFYVRFNDVPALLLAGILAVFSLVGGSQSVAGLKRPRGKRPLEL